MDPLQKTFTVFFELIGVSCKLHAKGASALEFSPGESPEGHPAHRVEIDCSMTSKSLVFLGYESLYKVRWHFFVVDEASVGAMKKSDFLAIRILQDFSVSIMNLGPCRHLDYLFQIVGVGQAEIDRRENQADYQGHQAKRQT